MGPVSCSDTGFDGGAGSFSGSSSNKASKIIEKDEVPEYICVKSAEDESFSDSVKRAKDQKDAIVDRERGKRCDDGFTEAMRTPDGTITEAVDGGSDSGNDENEIDEEDDDIDWDNPDSAKLREPMRISQTEGDEDARIKISFVTKKGNGEVVEVDFNENEKATKDALNICAKKGTTAVKITIVSDEGKGEHNAAQKEDMKWTRISKKGVKVHTDLDGCGFIGKCLDPGKDNGYIFECKNSKVKVEGLGI